MRFLEAIYIRQCCDILDGLLIEGPYTGRILERYFLFSLLWSLGALLELEERYKMEEYIMKHPSKMSMKFEFLSKL